MRESKIQYNPALSVKEIAKRSGVTEAAVRFYIKQNNIDRRFDKKVKIIDDCRKFLKAHPDATMNEVANGTGYSHSTIKIYWDNISTEIELTNFDSRKKQSRQLRQFNNFYATHPSVTQDILRVEDFHKNILEPFCGSGTMAEVIKKNGYTVDAYDIIDRGYGKVADFFKTDFQKGTYDIISNPPYDSTLCDAIKKCLKLQKGKTALLFPLRYLSGQARYTEIFRKNPPSRVYAYIDRIGIAKNAEFDKYDAGANPEIYAWYVWDKSYKGETILKWIQNQSYIPRANYDEVTILDGQTFYPNETFAIPIKDCIQFHSKALPENQVLSNHFDCIIKFRGIEFFSLEQLFTGLTYSDSPKILKEIMTAKSGIAAKKICRENYADNRDWDFLEKRYRIIALCHLYKYLSVKEYRDRLRETYPKTLVECPNGKDYHFGLVFNFDNGLFEGNNCSGRTSMIVRDMMKKMEDEAIEKEETSTNHILTSDEREQVIEKICNKVREEYDNNPQVIKDSKKLLEFIEKENIPTIKERRPSRFIPPIIDSQSKGLIVDFDDTLFDTSADKELRYGTGKKDWDAIFKLIPQYKLFEGWEDVLKWVKENKIKFGIISSARKELIQQTLEHFKIDCDVIVGWQQFMEKPNAILSNMAMAKMGIRNEQILYVGNSPIDEKQALCSQFKFAAACWHSLHIEDFEKRGIIVLKNPRDIFGLFDYPQREEETKAIISETKKKEKTPKIDRKINKTIKVTDKYVYFYQDTPLSNWWVCSPEIQYDNLSFTSSEALFMYLKAKVFRDDEMAVRIANTHYDDAKRLGRLIQNYSDEVWERERENAMYIALREKLATDNLFRTTLLSSDYIGKTFVEASPSDKIWGIHRSIKEGFEGKPWKGLNLLGKLLTELRDVTLGIKEPYDRNITPITDSEIKPKKAIKATISKNEYNTNGLLVRSIIGGCIGDIAGSSREGYKNNSTSARKLFTSQSHFTDDTILTVAMADWANNQRNGSITDYLIKWYSKYPNAGFGGLFKVFAETGEPQDSNGNGGAMRVAACAIIATSLSEALSMAEEQCRVSHNNEIAINGAKAIAASIYIAKDGVSNGKTDIEIKTQIKEYVERNFGYNLGMTLSEIQEQSQNLAKQREEFRRNGIASDNYLNMSNASLSCPMAITAFLLAQNFEECVRYSFLMLGDTDTIANIGCQISAQVYGIPQELIDDALVYLPSEMIEVLNRFENNNFKPTGITPPSISTWTTKNETIVYGYGDNDFENGHFETIASQYNRHPRSGYPIQTIGKTLNEISSSISNFITIAKANPEMRYHVRKVGYDKAGYSVEDIAPLFKDAIPVQNILLPKEIVKLLSE